VFTTGSSYAPSAQAAYVSLLDILTSLEFGVTTKGVEPLMITQSFHSSTERTVGVELNFETGEVRYFI
jgi:hypothetical protein